DSERQDRVVYRFTTSNTHLKIALPVGADLGSLEMHIDGRRLTPELDRQRELSIALPGLPRSEHLLELRYHFVDAQTLGQLALACPQLNPAGWTQQLYWQLVLPENEHVLFAPAHYTREFSWVWSGLLWQRQPPLEQRELESWVGTVSSGAVTSGDSPRVAGETEEQFAARERQRVGSTNRYLFSTVGTVEPLEVYSLTRARLVFLASLPLLLGGLLVIYFPSARHPAVLFALALFILSASLVDPESAVLLAQASSLGLVLTVVAAVMARVSVRPQVATIAVRGSSKAIERTATEMYQRAPGSRPSTATNPLVPTAPPEGES
ncbi:MAG: hypothetical protein HY288_12590, partial [Planctomycetia bacterium]|nr:hypothetical protein [Planctomycetia bacterium]